LIGQAINMTAKIVAHHRPMKQFNIAKAKSKFSESVDASAQSDGSLSQSQQAMPLSLNQGRHATVRAP
jgi:hypothetical protein